MLTSCFKDEAPNAECDIQKAFVVMDNWDAVFNNQTDASIDVPSNTSQISFEVKDNANISKMSPQFQLTPGATISPESGTELDFSNNARHKYTVTSEDGAWTREYYVGFGSKLLPLKYSFENIDFFIDRDGTEKYHQWYDYSRGSDSKIYRDWATGNGGFKLSMGKAPYEDYPTVSVEGGVRGRCVKLTTRSTGPFGVMSNMRIAAGNLFIGSFDLANALKDPLRATKFGIQYYKRPVSLKGYFKFKAGDVYTDEGAVQKDKKDRFDIYAIMYEANENSFMLDGSNSLDLTSDKLVSIARISEEDAKETDSWTPFELPFKAVNGKSIDPVKLQEGKYKLSIVLSSSVDGAYFKGAVGSTLYVDELELISEDN